MKKLLIILILCFTFFTLNGCNSRNEESSNTKISYLSKVGKGVYFLNENLESPTINFVQDEKIEKQDGLYDPYKRIVINDKIDGIIDNTSLIVVMINLANDVVIEQIDLSIDGKYRIEYYVKDSDNNLAKTSKILTVGEGIDSSNHDNVPYITGIGSYKTDCTSGIFDPLANLLAYDANGNDVKDRVTYIITNENTQEVIDNIPLDKNGKYIISYKIVDGSNIGTLERQVVIGDILGSVLSFKGLKGVGYVYDYEDINDYELIFSDEFDIDGAIDSTKFTYDIGNGIEGWGNWELEYYTDNLKNIKVSNGNMIITAIKENFNGFGYTSSKVKTDGKLNFRYGIVEIRAKLPTGIGTWPALWMMPTSNGYGVWPLCGEIDIMEHVGYNQDKVIGTVHTGAFNGSNGKQKGGSIYVENASNSYHVYKLEWLPDVMNWYVDDVLYFSYSPLDYSLAPGEDIWPFDKNYFLIFNIAVGGMYGGMNGVDENIWPQSMYIDYVRVYQSQKVLDLVQLP